jgi:hypothetical protein
MKYKSMKKRTWKKDEIEKAIAFLKNGENYEEISKKLNRTAKAVRVFFNKNGYSYLAEQRIKKKCLNCGNEFETTIKNGKKFCNNSCSATYNNKLRVLDYEKKKEVFCVTCNEVIEVNIRASNKNCKCDKCNSKKIIRNKENRIKLNKKYANLKQGNKCLNCGKELKSKQAFFCNNTCCAQFKFKEIFKKIESGDATLKEKQYKKYLIEKYGNKCMECGWDKINPFCNKVPIELEHIDGNSENNSLDNLKLLCPNCHSLTPTYKALNIGKGRHKRLERYKQGKSF